MSDQDHNLTANSGQSISKEPLPIVNWRLIWLAHLCYYAANAMFWFELVMENKYKAKSIPYFIAFIFIRSLLQTYYEYNQFKRKDMHHVSIRAPRTVPWRHITNIRSRTLIASLIIAAIVAGLLSIHVLLHEMSWLGLLTYSIIVPLLICLGSSIEKKAKGNAAKA